MTFPTCPTSNGLSIRQPEPRFPTAIVPSSAFNPLMEKYLDTFLPGPNRDEDLHLSESDLDSGGEMWLGRLDFRRNKWGLHLSYFNFRGKVHNPLRELNLAPGTTLEFASSRTTHSLL